MERYWNQLRAALGLREFLGFAWHYLLCRYRAVHGHWNLMITQYGFASRRHATTPRPEPYILTAPRRVGLRSQCLIGSIHNYTEEDDPWQLLDVEANETYSIPDTFCRERLPTLGRRRCRILKQTLAASGGFIYAVYVNESSVDVGRQIPHHFVCDPVRQTFNWIPAPPVHCCAYHTLVAMVVETGNQRYRIVVMERPPLHKMVPAQVYLYDSTRILRAWRKLCNVPSTEYIPRSCVVLDGIFYTMFENFLRRRFELYSCDLETGAWHHFDVRLPPHPRPPLVMKSPYQVVAAAGRLFLVGYPGPATQARIDVAVWEISLRRRRVSSVSYVSNFLTYYGLDDNLKAIPAVATGFGDSIVVSTFAGFRARLDLLRGNSWQQMMPFLQVIPCHSLFVAPFDLQMPPPLNT